MKSYIQGLITGGALVFASIVFIGSTKSEKTDKREIVEYLLITESGYQALNINSWIKDGYEPYGFPFIAEKEVNKMYYSQAMVKYK